MKFVVASLFCVALDLALLVGCLQNQNSSSQDAGLYGASSGLFASAKAVMQTNCANCHAYQSMSQDDLVAQGLMVPGNAEGSKLYYRLNGSSGANGPKTMPQGGGLSPGDLTTMHDWIQNASP